MIPNFVKPVQSAAINRRGFLWSAAASTACVGVAALKTRLLPKLSTSCLRPDKQWILRVAISG